MYKKYQVCLYRGVYILPPFRWCHIFFMASFLLLRGAQIIIQHSHRYQWKRLSITCHNDGFYAYRDCARFWIRAKSIWRSSAATLRNDALIFRMLLDRPSTILRSKFSKLYAKTFSFRICQTFVVIYAVRGNSLIMKLFPNQPFHFIRIKFLMRTAFFRCCGLFFFLCRFSRDSKLTPQIYCDFIHYGGKWIRSNAKSH